MFEHVKLTDRPITLNKKYYDQYLSPDAANGGQGIKLKWKDPETFWLTMFSKDENGKIENNGEVRCQIDILPADHADKNRVGSAREDPNHSPFLEPPKGRLSFSLNPWTMFC